MNTAKHNPPCHPKYIICHAEHLQPVTLDLFQEQSNHPTTRFRNKFGMTVLAGANFDRRKTSIKRMLFKQTISESKQNTKSKLRKHQVNQYFSIVVQYDDTILNAV